MKNHTNLHFILGIFTLALSANFSTVSAQVAPEIELFSTHRYEIVWTPEGSGRHHYSPFKSAGPEFNTAFYKAVYPAGQGYQELVRFGKQGYNPPSGMVVAKDIGVRQDALRNPTDYTYMWDDWDSGAHLDGSFWRPVPPPGYRCLGDMPQAGHNKPKLTDMSCVRNDLLIEGETGEDHFVWNSRDAGRNGAAYTDAFSAFRISPKRGSGGIEVRGAMIGTRGFFDDKDYDSGPLAYEDPALCEARTTPNNYGKVYVLKGSSVKAVPAPTAGEIKAMMSLYGPEIRMEKGEVFLPDDPAALLAPSAGAELIWGTKVHKEDSKHGFENFEFEELGRLPANNDNILEVMQTALAAEASVQPPAELKNGGDLKCWDTALFGAQPIVNIVDFNNPLYKYATLPACDTLNSCEVAKNVCWPDIFPEGNKPEKYVNPAYSLLDPFPGTPPGPDDTLEKWDETTLKFCGDEKDEHKDFTYIVNWPDRLNGGNIDRAKAYVRVQPLDGVYVELQYWVFYPYNGMGKYRLTLGDGLDLHEDQAVLGQHDSDWENVRVRVSLKNVWYPDKWYPENFVISRHSSEETVAYRDYRVRFNEDNHIIVYSAKDSHAQYLGTGDNYYARKKEINYTLGTFAIDLKDKTSDYGEVLQTYVLGKHELVSSAWPEITANPPNWFYYTGQWGGFIKLSYAPFSWNGEPIERQDEIANGKPGLLQRHEWNVPWPNNANLSSLRTNEGPISPAFKQNQFEYTMSVPNSASEIMLLPQAVNDEAEVTVTVNGVTTTMPDGKLLGKQSIPLPLIAGENNIRIDVKVAGTRATKGVQSIKWFDASITSYYPPVDAGNFTTKTYWLKVDRSVYTVTEETGSGFGSLADGIAGAQNGDSIHISSVLDGKTIKLSGSHIDINKKIRIDASNLSNRLKIDADQKSRHFYISSTGDLTLNNIELLGGNVATGGGSILNTGKMSLTGCRIVGNAAGTVGGGLLNASLGNVFIIDTTIVGNMAGQSGGGIYNNSSTGYGPQLFRSTVDHNDAPVGGAIHNEQGRTKLFNSTVAENFTSGGGYGVVDEDPAGGAVGIDMVYATVAEGLKSTGEVSLTNTMLSKIDGDYHTSGANVLGERSNASDRTGPGPYYEDPLSVSVLNYYGGSTKTMLPLPNSQANDAASPVSITWDQQLNNRSNISDIGSVEAPNLNLPYLTLSDGQLSPALSGSGTTYSLTVAYDIDSMSFATSAPLSGSSVSSQVDGGGYGPVSDPLPLDVGLNVVEIKVDFFGVFDDIYTVNVTRSPPSNNANLRFLASSTMQSDVAFNRSTTQYNAGTIADDTLRLWANGEHHAAKVEVRANGGSFTEISKAQPLSDGGVHGLRLTEDGSVLGFGNGSSGQTTDLPASANGVMTAVAAGESHSIAIDEQAKLRAWGQNNSGQTEIPAGLNRIVAVSSSDHNLAITRDATVVAWGGSNSSGQLDVPAGLSDVIAVAAGGLHSLALKANGTVVMWGSNTYPVPVGLNNVVAIAASGNNSLALKADGTVVRWGFALNGGLSDVPSNLEGVVDISAGDSASFALLGDGSVKSWGISNQCEASTYVSPIQSAIDLSAGRGIRSVLKQDGSVYSWGAYGRNPGVEEIDSIKTPVSTVPAISLRNGANTVEVKVTAEDGSTTKTYTITVMRDDNAIASLYERAPEAIDDVLLDNKVYYKNVTLIGQTVYYRVIGSTPTPGGFIPVIGGTDSTYHLSSHLANTAVHAGVLNDGEEGVVAITIVAAPNEYFGTTQNGITSRSDAFRTIPNPRTAIKIAAFTGDPLAEIKKNYSIRAGLTPKDLRCYTNEIDNTLRFLVRGWKPDDPNSPLSEENIYYQAYEDGEDANGSHVENATFVDRYSHDSSLAVAAVHAGILQHGETGIVDVTYQGKFSFDKDDLSIDTALKNGVKPSKAANEHTAAAIGGYTLKGIVDLNDAGEPILGSNADLSSLTMFESTFAPAFDPSVTTYTMTRTDPFRQLVNVIPATADDQASIALSINGAGFESTPSDFPSDAFYLASGQNTIDVRVTAEDGTTTKNYRLNVNVQVDAGADSDNDGEPDATDNCPVPNPDQKNTDGDLLGDACDDDDDNDGINDTSGDTAPLDPKICMDMDSDGCDDCAIGTDGFGPLPDHNVAKDGVDTDGNGQCNVTDPDDDGDGKLDDEDNCPVNANPGQEDDNSNGIGDACENTGVLCFPVKTPTTISVICI